MNTLDVRNQMATSPKVLSLAALYGSAVGLLAAWAFEPAQGTVAGLTVPTWAALVTGVGVATYLSYHRMLWSIVGTALYAVAGLLALRSAVVAYALRGTDATVVQGVETLYVSLLLTGVAGTGLVLVGRALRRRGNRRWMAAEYRRWRRWHREEGSL